MAPTALLLNDTTRWYHWGCTATSLGLKSLISERYELVDSLPINSTYDLDVLPATNKEFGDREFFERHVRANQAFYARIGDADVVIINGEGTIHAVTPPTIRLLYLAYAAKRFLDKTVCIVNHSAYPTAGPAVENAGLRNLYAGVYRALDYAAIREPVSKALMDTLGVSSTLSFDSLLHYLSRHRPALKKRGRSLVISGSVVLPEATLRELAQFAARMAAHGYVPVLLTGAADFPAEDDAGFVKAWARHVGGDWRHVEANSLDEWFSTIGEAALLVSGRFHHTLAAFGLGTPFVAMESNTPKITGLSRMLGSPPPLRYDDSRFGEGLSNEAAYALSPEFREAVWSAGRLENLCELARRNVPPQSSPGR